MDTTPLQQVLDAANGLPPEDQEMLVDLLRQRLAEQRRTEIAQNASALLRSVRDGTAAVGSVDQLKKDLKDNT